MGKNYLHILIVGVLISAIIFCVVLYSYFLIFHTTLLKNLSFVLSSRNFLANVSGTDCTGASQGDLCDQSGSGDSYLGVCISIYNSELEASEMNCCPNYNTISYGDLGYSNCCPSGTDIYKHPYNNGVTTVTLGDCCSKLGGADQVYGSGNNQGCCTTALCGGGCCSGSQQCVSGACKTLITAVSITGTLQVGHILTAALTPSDADATFL